MSLPKYWSHLFLVLLFILASGCKPKSSTTSTSDPTTPTLGAAVTLTGTITYDYVSASTGKLNYSAGTQLPVRNVYLELSNANTGTVLGTTSTNDSGQYSFSVQTGQSVKIRVFARMITPNVIIEDNTNSDAEYVIATAPFAVNSALNKDIRATSGWTGTNAGGSYSAARLSAPFAMLDSIYTIAKKISTSRPSLVYPALKVNWSINNISVSGTKSSGQIGTSHFDPSDNQLYILGQADVDSDEYDKHIIVHEWGHFFESNLSRSDSMGGSHGSGDAKDVSLAFGEGFGNALSAMAFDPDVIYSDTYGARQQSGFTINMESGTDSNKGWFSETSIQQILYDIYDNNSDGSDSISQGIGPIVDVLTGAQKTTTAGTSIYSFVTALKASVPAIATALNTLVAAKNIAPITSAYGDGETFNGGWSFNLPLYNQMTLGGATVSFSLYGDFGANDFYGLYNSVFNNKYVKFTASSSTTRLIVSTTDSFQMDVYYRGTVIYTRYQPRSGAAAIGPFTYNVPTTPGLEYRINFLTDQDVVFDSAAVVDLTVTGTAI